MSQLPISQADSDFSEPKPKPIDSVNLECLDTLLEKYLCLLDRQQKLQSSLAEQLSSGFFALAQANFSCPPGRRYGPDYFDERMKATRNISIKSERHTEQSTKELQGNAGTTEPLDAHSTFSVELIPSPVPEEDPIGNVEAQVSSPVEGTQPESPQESPDSSQPNITLVEKPRATRKKFGSADPIHWYGILVPQSLRKAQASFTAAIDHEVPDLASTTDEMRALEQQITNLRDQLKSESSHDTS
ncbi:uncharacterized protein N7529_006319 [Penicillium soppii]|uniref:uncharacterized protein n=1 Tax=Penicillium soppii TaxID=69789 RepID=UPI00254892CD|nr:uncharacterized protein N7529_006319 [Penicillium soppii]KAJ5864403.1 hypothetical protein N7529_006319 [Penicillium soppii]